MNTPYEPLPSTESAHDFYETEEKFESSLTKRKQTSSASTRLKLVFALCLLLSVSLASANVWASHRLSLSLADALPAADVMELGRADQYDGLSDNSRYKRQYNAFCLYFRISYSPLCALQSTTTQTSSSNWVCNGDPRPIAYQ